MNPSKKKVFICITKSNWGGAQKYVFDIATGAPKETIDMTVLLGGDGELKKRLDEAGVPVIMLKNSQRDIDTKKEFGLFLELWRIFKKEKPDVIHLNSSKMGGTGALVGRLLGIKKIIFIAHGWAFNEDRPRYQKIILRVFHIITILLAHQTIAVSQITSDQIGWPWNKKIVVIRNGLRKIDFLEKDSARKIVSEKISQKNIGPDIPWIGTISELHKTKGLHYAIEAIARMQKNSIFIVIGEGQERKNLEQLIVNLHMTERIFLVGRIESAASYIKAFDIFTLTSISEALPYALLEAGAAALPVVASKVGGIPEIIEDGKTGILARPRNTHDIERAITFLLTEHTTARLLGKNLETKIKKEFTPESMLTKTLALYQI
jgi:glycosyltransferase involved in cell wall biosynthesis